MDAFGSILVDIDATATARPALERAILLAKRSDATLTIPDVFTLPPHAHHYLPAGIEESLVQDRRQRLARITEIDTSNVNRCSTSPCSLEHDAGQDRVREDGIDRRLTRRLAAVAASDRRPRGEGRYAHRRQGTR